MKKSVSKHVLAALMVGAAVPAVALAADEDLLRRVEMLSRELEQLKAQVQANDQKTTKAVEEAKGQASAAGVADLKG